jgi:hypothetical protein
MSVPYLRKFVSKRKVTKLGLVRHRCYEFTGSFRVREISVVGSHIIIYFSKWNVKFRNVDLNWGTFFPTAFNSPAVYEMLSILMNFHYFHPKYIILTELDGNQ